MPRAAKSTTEKKNPVVKEVTDRWNASWSYAKENHHARWERNYKLYNNQRSIIAYQGVTNTFVPMVFSVTETMTSALASGRPSIDFVPHDMYAYTMAYFKTGRKPNLKALNNLFDYYWDCDNWDLKTVKTVRGGLLYGTSCEWVYWDQDKPRIINMNIRDAIIDPNLTDPMQLLTHPKDYYSGRRYITTKAALEAEMVVDPETGDMKKRFKNLAQVVTGADPSGDEGTDKQKKEMLIGAIGDTENLVEVLEIVDGDRIRSVANRRVEIEDRPNELGIHYLVIHRFIADESQILGKAIVDPIAQPQELLNDTTNQSVDAVTDVLDPQYELEPDYQDQLEIVAESGPGTVFPFTPGSLKRVDKGTVTPQMFNERQNIKNEIREAVGADQIVQGVQNDGNATATEIQAQLNQAGQRFELFVRMLEKEGLYQRSKIVYKMILKYVGEMQLVPTTSPDGPKFYVFDPTEFDDTYEPKIQLEASIRNSKRRVQQETLQAYQALIADPTNNLWQVKKILYPKMFDLNEEELDRIIGQQAPTPEGGDMGEAGADMTGDMPLDEGELIDELAGSEVQL